MEQVYEKYDNEDQEVWNILFSRQKENLKSKGAQEYLDCLSNFESALNQRSIPRFHLMNEVLQDSNGWKIHVVPGLIPVKDFFRLLAKKEFPASTWVRKRHELDYLEEPDMFHDIFGHTPLLLNSKYSDFMQHFGEIGEKYIDDDDKVLKLQRLYWFSIEFGLLGTVEHPLIYGAGILSSYGESNHIYTDELEILPFDMQEIYSTPFINSEIQMKYFLLDSLDDLYEKIDEVESKL